MLVSILGFFFVWTHSYWAKIKGQTRNFSSQVNPSERVFFAGRIMRNFEITPVPELLITVPTANALGLVLTSLLIVVLFLGSLFCITAHSSAHSIEKPMRNLRNWDIQKFGPRQFINHYRNVNIDRPKIIYLRRANSTNCIAILEVKEDGTPVLNPTGYSYGPIPPLREVTAEQAEQLWSTNPQDKPPSSGIRTFELHSNQPKSFWIDFLLVNGRIHKFRVRAEKSLFLKIDNQWNGVK
jgi:hypothetical protein